MFVSILVIACTSEFKKGEEKFKTGDFEGANFHFKNVYSTDSDYKQARTRLAQIDSILAYNFIDSARSAFGGADYELARKFYRQIPHNADKLLYAEAQAYLKKIDSIDALVKLEYQRLAAEQKAEEEKREQQQAKIADKETRLSEAKLLKEATNEFKRLYDELLSFKDKSDFHKYGFAISYKYNRWLKEVEALMSKPGAKLLFYEKGIVTGDLQMLGFEYMRSEGKETEYSQWVRGRFKEGFKD